jgi:hypothetical protein
MTLNYWVIVERYPFSNGVVGGLNPVVEWSEMTLNYRMMVKTYPNLKEEVGGSIPDCEISSLPDGKLARWSTASCALVLACQPSVLKYKRKKSCCEIFFLPDGKN